MKQVEQRKIRVEAVRALKNWQRNERRAGVASVGLELIVLIVLMAGSIRPVLSASLYQLPLPFIEKSSPPEVEPDPPSRTIGQITNRLEARIRRSAEAAEVVIRASQYYRQGEALTEVRKPEEARKQYQRVQAILAEVDTGLLQEPLLQRLVQRVGQKLAQLDGHRGSGEFLMKLAGRDAADPLVAVAKERIGAALRRHQTTRQGMILTALERLSAIRPAMERIFRQEGVPVELLAVGLVESAYNPLALSAAGAKGIWQFVKPTARRYGLISADQKDHRSDLFRSTRAAARHLRDLYQRFGDWPLALAAYNAGEKRVEQAMKSSGGGSFWELAERGSLPQETIEYVPSVLAAIRILRHPKQYGFLKSDSASLSPPGGPKVNRRGREPLPSSGENPPHPRSTFRPNQPVA